MKQRTVMITGANSGIGLAASRMFADKGHTVIMTSRDTGRSKPLRDDIVTATGNDRVRLLRTDMSSMASIREAAAEFGAEYNTLDILIHNAAYFEHGAPYRESADGLELTFATNVLGPWLLTALLHDRLRASDDARILHAGSNIVKHFFHPDRHIDVDALRGRNDGKYRVYDHYRDSKMALLMLTFRMAEALRPDGIAVNALQINGAKMSPETLRKFSTKWRLVARIQNLFFRPPGYMASVYYDLCTKEKYRGVTGRYFNHTCEPMQVAPDNPGGREQLAQLLGASIYPRYAHREDVTDSLWSLCRETSGMEISPATTG
jgi:NAD(P)-dependent dehydrogenase (short-subunit alcohol dehydrogenase family)